MQPDKPSTKYGYPKEYPFQYYKPLKLEPGSAKQAVISLQKIQVKITYILQGI